MNIGVNGLAIIPAGSPVANSFELLCSRKMARFVGELRQLSNHEIVLFELPSVLACDDALAFSPLVDCAPLVVEEGSTKLTDTRRALTPLEPTKIRSIRGDNEIGKTHAKSAAFLAFCELSETEGSVRGLEAPQTHLPVRLQRYAFECFLPGPLFG
jgi:hypothetical protein